MEQQWADLGFVPPPARERRMVISLAGWPKSGKTHFALSGKAPVALFDLNQEAEGVADQVSPPPMVSIIRATDPNAGGTQEEWQRQWQLFVRQLTAAYQLGAGTVVIDSWSDAYELARLARFGKLLQVMPHLYGALNAEFRSLMRMMTAAQNTDTVLIQQLRVGFETKADEVVGWRETGYRAQVLVETDPQPNAAGSGIPDFGVVIKSNRLNPHTTNMRIPGEQATMGYLSWVTHDWKP